MTKSQAEKNIKLRVVIYAILILILAYVAIIAILVYGFGKNNFLVDKTAQSLSFPAAVVGKTDVVTMRELGDDLVAVKKFYENQNFSDIGLRVDFATADGQKRLKIKERQLLNKLIENKMIEKLAAERDIVITKEMASQNVDREIAQYGNGSEIEKTLLDLYGWSMDNFKEKIVKPDMYRMELNKKRIATDSSLVQAKTKIAQAQAELKNGASFAEAAKKYSEGESAKNGGELGWFTADQMLPEIAVAAFAMKKGEQSDVLESSLGFHIIQVDDRKTEEGVDKIRVRQILVRTNNFPNWLLEQEKKINIFIPLKDYHWNKETATVEFVSQEMKDFENNLDKNSAGDISILF